MAIPGTVTVTSIIAPTSSGDTYPVIDPKYGVDGLRNVSTNAERNAIPNDRRKQGMIVGVDSTGITKTDYWSLLPSPWTGSDSDWSLLPFSSGSTSGNTSYWSASTGVNAIVVNNSDSIASGVSSLAEGYQTTASGNYSHAGGINSHASGVNSFVHGSSSVALGDNTIVLGANITGTTSDTTYVDNLNIKSIGSGTSVTNLGIDSSGNVVSGTTASAQTVGIKYNILSGETIDIPTNYEYFVYGDLTLEGTINNSGKLVIINGSFINSGGIYNQLSGGSLNIVSSQTINKYSNTTGLTANTPLVITHNLGTPDVIITVKDLNTGYKINVNEYNYNLNNVTIESITTLTNIRITIVG